MIELVFENCEEVILPKSAIVSFTISSNEETLYIGNKCRHEAVTHTADYVHLILKLPKLNSLSTSYAKLHKKHGVEALDVAYRIRKCNDITQIHIRGRKAKSYMIHWEDEEGTEGTENALQVSWIDEERGELIVVIGKL